MYWAQCLLSFSEMLQIGLTGGIGSGKSIVGRVFHTMGAPVYQADQRAKTLVATDADLKKAIQSTFGAKAYQADGSINRTFMAETVFNDDTALQQLNQLVHPAVKADYEVWLQSQDTSYVIHEAALILEAGFQDEFDGLISVSAPENLRKARVKNRDGLTEEQVQARMERQYDQSYKDQVCDHVIQNDDHQLLIPSVWELNRYYTHLARKSGYLDATLS